MAAAAEGSLTGTESAIWLTKLRSIMAKLTFRSNINSNRVSPLLPISVSTVPLTITLASSQQQPNINNHLHPITQMMLEQELGKVIITVAVPIAAALLVSGSNGDLLVVRVVAVGLMIGCMAIWNGILFRKNFPRLANVLEQIGINLVLVSIYGLVAAFLPKGFSWILWLSGAFCLIPLCISLL